MCFSSVRQIALKMYNETDAISQDGNRPFYFHRLIIVVRELNSSLSEQIPYFPFVSSSLYKNRLLLYRYQSFTCQFLFENCFDRKRINSWMKKQNAIYDVISAKKKSLFLQSQIALSIKVESVFSIKNWTDLIHILFNTINSGICVYIYYHLEHNAIFIINFQKKHV